MNVDFTPGELVRAQSAIVTTVRRMRDRCRESDAEFGDMNDIYRVAIRDHKSSSRKMLEVLRLAGYAMENCDIADDPIDEGPAA